MSSWKKVGSAIADYAPLLGSALGGPLGGGLGSVLASAFGTTDHPDAVLQAVKTDPMAAVKLQEIQSNERIKINESLAMQHIAMLDNETKRIQTVNTSMQAESKSEHWMQWAWRPFWGFISATAFFVVCCFVCYLAYQAVFSGQPEALVMIPQLIGSMTMLFSIPGAILGVSAWHRGVEKRENGKSKVQSKQTEA